jgi:hypothetical protein
MDSDIDIATLRISDSVAGPTCAIIGLAVPNPAIVFCLECDFMAWSAAF